MSEWKEYKIGDILQLEYGKSLKNYHDGVGLYDVFGTNGKIGKTDIYLYNKPSIIIGRKGAYREVHIANKPFYVIDTAFYTKNKLKWLDTVFLYYWFKTIDINLMDSGSAIPSTSRDEVYDLDIFLPTAQEQKSIASILSGLDLKIDLLHRQNATLEKMGETLFREWFVVEADESWEVKKLKEVVDIGIGRTPPRKEFKWFSKLITDVKWVSIKDLGDSGIFVFDTSEYLTEEAVDKFNIPVIPPDTVLLSFKMTLGRVAITTEYMLSNEAIAHFKFKEETPFPKEFLYFYLKTYPYETLGSTSSIVTSINSGMIKDMEIIVPDHKTLGKFKHQVIEIFDKIKSNQTQIRTLTDLRDTLLPKLMSGEVTVK